ncbi:RNF14 [Lepeophtheirus salmonis]|uniref:RNF14 n=1 Tax=Lepeophtheirus salmonis TaxID=72036 RepID=A0A7R8D6B9_LEPSM|nr:RNF14 [Lepeophtheirus salmonis]CAF3014712.1 RNF14 [Lepeophtheirus salmonis]
MAKDRITVMLAASMSGEKLRPLVMGKSQNSRFFLTTFQNSDTGQKYHVINGQLWSSFTNNTLQCAVSVLRSILVRMDDCNTASELTKKITILDVIQWLENAWMRVEETTISKCFAKVGFTSIDERIQSIEEVEWYDSELIPLHQVVPDLSYQDFINVHSDLAVTKQYTIEDINAATDKEVMEMASKILLYANESCDIPEDQRADFIKVASKLYDTQASLIINQIIVYARTYSRLKWKWDLCEQTDEVMVLSEIFGNKLFEFDEKHSKGQISNTIELNGSTIKIGVSKRSINDNHEREILLSKDLDHIPPISLVFEFPANYPSVSMPKFSLSCLWLNSKQRSIWKSLWNENKGSVILFNWITFLQNEVLEFLDFEKEIIIEEKDVSSLFNTPLKFIQELESYDVSWKEGIFHESLFTCNICFQDKFGKECVQFKGCDHVYCKICMRSYFETKIQEGSESGIVCPTHECSVEALPTQIKELVSEKLYSDYENGLIEMSLRGMSDVIRCPMRHCRVPTIIDIKSNSGECPSCRFVVPLAKQRELMDKYNNADDEERKKMEKIYSQKFLLESQNAILCHDLIKDISMNCPNCFSAIQKSEGCNKMFCTKCSTNFCYICGTKLFASNPYAHFSDVRSSKYYESQLIKQKRIDDRMKDMKERLSHISSPEPVDTLILELEKQRDLSRTIVHVDMDAYYAAVEMLGPPPIPPDVPIAVGSTGMLSTSNYPARKYGVRAGMPGFIAKKLCPHLRIIPPDFTKYTTIAEKIHITDYLKNNATDPEKVAETIRQEIYDATGLTASAGIASNALLAKPNRDEIMNFVGKLPVRKVGALGMGPNRLSSERERKSMSTETTFRDTSNESELLNICRDLSNELSQELLNANLRGKCITLKIKTDTFVVKIIQLFSVSDVVQTSHIDDCLSRKAIAEILNKEKRVTSSEPSIHHSSNKKVKTIDDYFKT